MKKLQWRINERHAYGETQYALDIRIDNEVTGWWTIKTFKAYPKRKTVEELIEVLVRGMQIYHKSFKVPEFYIDVHAPDDYQYPKESK